jgi:PIN domain nuclease of toxin-antitoxin system
MLLLDTHIALAVLGLGSVVLPGPMKDNLSSNTKSFVSVVSIWEIAIKSRLGKIKLTIGLDQLPGDFEKLNLRVLPVHAVHAIADIGSEPGTRNPFDRLLLGVCAAEGMKLVTLDRVLIGHPLAWRET